MHTDYRDLREFLSWMALFFIDGARWDLSRFSCIFHSFSLGPFGVGAGVVVGFASRVEDEIRPQWIAWVLRLPRELKVGPVDQRTTQESPL